MPITAKPPSQRLIDLVGALGGNWSGYSAMRRCPAHMDARQACRYGREIATFSSIALQAVIPLMC